MIGTVAVIGTFYQRHENTGPLLNRVMNAEGVGELWIMCEGEDDYFVAEGWLGDPHETGMEDVHLVHLATPRDEDGRYSVIPYSHKINWALDQTRADYIVYLDNGSMPDPEKYELMARALDEHPEWGAVYCGQRRTGHAPADAHANGVVHDAYCVLNYTQVMHRRTDDRWTLDMGHAVPDLADALFWRSLHASLGPFYPVAEGRLLDEHHIPDNKAVGL